MEQAYCLGDADQQVFWDRAGGAAVAEVRERLWGFGCGGVG